MVKWNQLSGEFSVVSWEAICSDSAATFVSAGDKLIVNWLSSRQMLVTRRVNGGKFWSKLLLNWGTMCFVH